MLNRINHTTCGFSCHVQCSFSIPDSCLKVCLIISFLFFIFSIKIDANLKLIKAKLPARIPGVFIPLPPQHF